MWLYIDGFIKVSSKSSIGHRDIKIWWFLISCLFTCSALGSTKGELGDRLVMELDRRPFSQRHMESYMGIKAILSDQLSRPFTEGLVSEKNWQRALAAFRGDMLISLETKRLGRFFPVTGVLTRNLSLADFRIRENPDYARFVKRLQIDRRKLVNMIADIFQVDSYWTSKERSSAGKNGRWFLDLEQKYLVRMFVGSATYKIIRPGTP